MGHHYGGFSSVEKKADGESKAGNSATEKAATGTKKKENKPVA